MASTTEETFVEGCWNNDLYKVKVCIDLGVDVNCEVGNVWGLLIAAHKNYSRLCDLLLAHPSIDVNKYSLTDGTALSVACKNGHADIVRKLVIAPGIDVNLGKGRGLSPMFQAITNERIECVRILASVNGVNWDLAAIHAVEKNNVDILRILSSIPSVNWNLDMQRTPAMVAAEFNRLEALRFLKTIPSIDWNLTNFYPHSALTMALSRNHLEAAKIIMTAPGLKINVEMLKIMELPRETIMECMKSLMDMGNSVNSNMNSLMASLGDGGSLECPVCMMAFTADRQVFQCGNGHFTCGTCHSSIQNNQCPRCRGNFIGRAHDFESFLQNR